jgi:hypothetical protein
VVDPFGGTHAQLGVVALAAVREFADDVPVFRLRTDTAGTTPMQHAVGGDLVSGQNEIAGPLLIQARLSFPLWDLT